MLVFTRRREESIVIGDHIEVRILRVGRNGVRLGVTAPSNVPVHRQEIYELIRAANRSAADAPIEPADLARQLRERRGSPPAEEP